MLSLKSRKRLKRLKLGTKKNPFNKLHNFYEDWISRAHLKISEFSCQSITKSESRKKSRKLFLASLSHELFVRKERKTNNADWKAIVVSSIRKFRDSFSSSQVQLFGIIQRPRFCLKVKTRHKVWLPFLSRLPTWQLLSVKCSVRCQFVSKSIGWLLYCWKKKNNELEEFYILRLTNHFTISTTID